MLEYLVLYESRSGNTKKIAAAIFSNLPGNSKDLIDITTDKSIPEAKVYFIGFCVNCGTCSMEVSDFINGLGGKRIALFGTCGMGDSPDYYKAIEKSVHAWIENDNDYLGAFICQGKMPRKVREKYEFMRAPENEAQMDMYIRNFDEALTHPDSLDIEHAKVFTQKCLKRLDEMDGEFKTRNTTQF
ncbi:flavodoxin family protein BilS [Extibacter muris]|uniref:flavodoxin family protein BilS n=1 Tax=Extibacter muris TaxID=1796622 RepID=UPI001D06CA2C|nr:flavodoxin family protein BilS [Extibacter muris]MCB6203051.1 flavodoxin family protein [Extibacter muris]MCQ4664274.1 flavodoxin family protein [Extibacter muris]MCQ4695189.1 flavodoxin family protein [Extibacter muris]